MYVLSKQRFKEFADNCFQISAVEQYTTDSEVRLAYIPLVLKLFPTALIRET